MTQKPIDFRSPENLKKLAAALSRHGAELLANVPVEKPKEDKKGA